MMKLTAVILAAVLGTAAFAAEQMTCTSKDKKVERKVYIKRAEAGKPLPCQVQYVKDGEDKMVYEFKNEDRCQEKMDALVEKLKASFDCQ